MKRYFPILFLMLVSIVVRQRPEALGSLAKTVSSFILVITITLGIVIVIQDIYESYVDKKIKEKGSESVS